MLGSFLIQLSFHIYSDLVCTMPSHVPDGFLLGVCGAGVFLAVLSPKLRCTYKAESACHRTANHPVVWCFGYFIYDFTPSDMRSGRCCLFCCLFLQDSFVCQLCRPACLPGPGCMLKVHKDLLRMGPYLPKLRIPSCQQSGAGQFGPSHSVLTAAGYSLQASTELS